MHLYQKHCGSRLGKNVHVGKDRHVNLDWQNRACLASPWHTARFCLWNDFVFWAQGCFETVQFFCLCWDFHPLTGGSCLQQLVMSSWWFSISHIPFVLEAGTLKGRIVTPVLANFFIHLLRVVWAHGYFYLDNSLVLFLVCCSSHANLAVLSWDFYAPLIGIFLFLNHSGTIRWHKFILYFPYSSTGINYLSSSASLH